MKIKVLIAVAITVVVALMTCIIVRNVDKGKEDRTTMPILQITDFIIEDRTTLKQDGKLLVGYNLKELENNFYDIKIENTDKGVELYLNKLWYENYGQDYIQDDYLAKICRELSKRLNIQYDTTQLEYVLYKYIKDNYLKVKQNEKIEKLLTDKLSLEFNQEESIAILIIRSR